MKVSLFSERITFEKNTPVVDENANHRNHWEAFYSCWAYAAASSYQQKEEEKAGVIISDDALVFTVRCCSELADINSTNYRVRFRGDTYNITSVDRMNYDRKSLKVSCEKERRDDNVDKESQH